MGSARARVVAGPSGQKYVWFWCAGCITHHRIAQPRWTFNGDVDRPTFSPSVLVELGKHPPMRCHSFVRDGRIEYLSDSTHHLAGQTVDLEPIADSMGED